jgi:spore maturation protein CgeB
MGFDVGVYNAPTENERFSNEYAVGLFNEIGRFNPDLVFSLRYFSAVSVICDTAKVKYAAWVCRSYEPDIYSCTLLNECNYIFFADKSLAEEFADGGFKHIYFLPLGVNRERILSVTGSIGGDFEYDSDLTMMQDINFRSNVKDNPLSKDSPLSNATKGYLEGCLACQHQISGLPSMAGNLPDYAQVDLAQNFPAKISGDSIETSAHYYDYNYFNRLITYSQRDIHFHYLVSCGKFAVNRTHLYNGCDEYTATAFKVHSRADYAVQVPAIARKSKINVVITHRNWKSAIPQMSWDIMASGGFLINNIQSDFFEIFKCTLPVLYEDRVDLRKKGMYYLENDSERESIARGLSEEVLEKHTYENRINELLEKI